MSGERRYRRLGSSCRTIFAFFKDYYNEECPRLENYYRGTNNRTFSRDLSSKMAKFVQRLIVLWLITIYYSLLINDNDN